MPRSSRQKSHRSHKRSARDATERSDCEDDGSSRNRKLTLVEAGPGSGATVWRDADMEKWKASSDKTESKSHRSRRTVEVASKDKNDNTEAAAPQLF